MPFGAEKLEWRGYPTVKKIDDMFIRFDMIHDLMLNNTVTLKSGLHVTQGHSNWYHSKA